MPANAPYPGETPEQFQRRMQQQAMAGANIGALGAQPALPAPGAMVGGMNNMGTGGPTAADRMPPMGPPDPLAAGPPPPPDPFAAGPPAPGAGGVDLGNTLDMTPEMLGALSGTYGTQLELGGLEKQLAQAEALRAAVSPEGRQAGRAFVAANPLEHLATGMKQWEGRKRAKKLEPEIAKKRGEIGENVKTWAGEVFKRKK